ncbi:MAG: diguanylate cyclase (GGDEF)-like protein [Flavobacteriales bacterium]|jgi:diguanylate cyclase (GGDEF)-like protein
MQQTIRLLILNDSSSEAERLISMLKNAGRTVRAKHAESIDILNKLLQEQPWDLMIGMESTKNISPVDASKQIRRLNKDIPLVLLTDREGSQANVEGLKYGARDVVLLDEDQHLLLVIERELENRRERDLRRNAERRYIAITQRNQQLLDSSRDGIAYVQDGMFLYANDSFAELLDFESRDDLECVPVIDFVADSDHDMLKKSLKNFTLKGGDSDEQKLTLNALCQNGDARTLKVEISKATYDEESCIQFLIRTRGADAQELEAQIAVIKNQDTATGLYNKTFLLESIGELIKRAVDKEYNSAIFHIGIDDFTETVGKKLGVGSADKVLGSIAQFAKTQVKKTDALCRYADDSFILVAPKINAIKAMERAEVLGRALRDHIFDVNSKTLHFNFHIGISIINETSSHIDTPIDHSLKALQLARNDTVDGKDHMARIYENEGEGGGKRNISRAVQTALDNNKFKLLFQPILSLRGSEKEHYEVLLRLIDEGGEQVSPHDFLATAATIGATTKIDRWVILETIKTLADHKKNGTDTLLIVNLSAESVIDESLPPWLSVAFKAAGIAPRNVVFQINETDINDHLNQSINFIDAVNKIGCGVCVNHFGCVLSPFKVLGQLKANYIKIDGSFTQDLQNNEEGLKALNELVSELHQQDKITIVPFVESASILSKLWQSGVHYIQGYYLQGPTDEMNYDFDMES